MTPMPSERDKARRRWLRLWHLFALITFAAVATWASQHATFRVDYHPGSLAAQLLWDGFWLIDVNWSWAGLYWGEWGWPESDYYGEMTLIPWWVSASAGIVCVGIVIGAIALVWTRRP